MRSTIFLITVIGVVLGLTAPSASARCAQRDLAGEWQFYNSFAEAGVGGGWSRCLLAVDRDGGVSGLEECADFDGGTSSIVGGTLTITSECVVTGQVTVQDGPDTGTAIIEHATMDMRGTTVQGVGRDEDSVPGFFFTMIKK